MSAIATMRVVAADDAGRGASPVAAAGSEVDFDCSGYVVLYLLLYLEGKGFPLAYLQDGDEESGMAFVMTAADQRFLDQLDPNRLDMGEIASYFEEMEYTFDRLELTVREALELLREQIAALSPSEKLIVHIG